MSGVAKTDPELDLAIGSSILSIQIESIDEFERVAARARALGQQASISVRLNPGIAIDSHAHVATGHDQSKFGISLADLGAAWQGIDRAADVLRAVGVSTHIGSMLRSVEPYLEAARVVCEVAQARMSSGGWLKFVDFGGGFAIDYGSEPAPEPVAFVNAGIELLRRSGLERLALVIEPGRALVGPHGVLVASAIGVKNTQGTRWFLVDAAMNDLLRPALYGARHRIEPLERPPGGSSWRVAGPVCESADDFGDHPLGDPPPDRVVIRDAGAYGFSMASEYNGRPLPAEIFARDSELVSVAPSPGRGRWLESRLKA
jgi:diaminopimelate decarboxylase